MNFGDVAIEAPTPTGNVIFDSADVRLQGEGRRDARTLLPYQVVAVETA